MKPNTKSIGLDPAKRRSRGFEPAFGLLTKPVQKIGETRGFALPKLLTGWREIVGPELSQSTRPVKISYAKQGMGATLTLLVSGALAPIVEMQKRNICQRVNAAYGYKAISRIVITQTSAVGFAEGQATFTPRKPPQPNPKAAEIAACVHDGALRDALTEFAQNILTRQKQNSKGN